MFHALGYVPVPVTPYLVAILATLAICVVVFAATMLLDSEAETPLGRVVQRLRLSTLRMSRMLRRREVGILDYTGRLSVATIKQQAEVCARCNCTELCDRALASTVHGPNSHTHYSFCPNQPAIERYLAVKAVNG